MACYKPIQAFESGLNKNGNKRIVFEPKTIKDKPLALPCGRCIGCRIEKTRQWALRGMCELITTRKKKLDSCFLTLTYKDSHYPENGDLVKKDIQDFVKRLRKRHQEISTLVIDWKKKKIVRKSDIRVFYCGEYGELNLRPHWHLIIYGYGFPDKKLKEVTATGNLLYTSNELELGQPEKRIPPLWHQGFHRIGAVTFDSIQYVAKYVTKKLDGEKANEIPYGDYLRHYERHNPKTGEICRVSPEFAETPRRPGLGFDFIRQYYKEVYPSDTIAVLGKGVQRTTKYFDRIMKDIDNDLLEMAVKKRREYMLSNLDELSETRQKTKEDIKKRKLKKLKALRQINEVNQNEN
jgi:hypothetical protein